MALKLVVAEERSLRKRMSLMNDFGLLEGGTGGYSLEVEGLQDDDLGDD